MDWGELPTNIREAAILLKYTKQLWKTDQEPNFTQSWHELSPLEQTAARTLGETPETWDYDDDDSDMDPWFKCNCGNEKCHSKDGFRGVSSFEIEDRKRVYWICSPWIRNQIDWKTYEVAKSHK
mmetsp:Transcript_4145/g.4814  ORF Transcript_4145/g.4814 Transcript_4145/m.4814 type:complete len:124 (-) Transcript_4145:123-494(-)